MRDKRSATTASGTLRRTLLLTVTAMVLALPSTAGDPDAQSGQPGSGRFQPSQEIEADTIVEFPVNI